MKRLLLSLTMITTTMVFTAGAQEAPLNPFDTLASHVGAIRQELDVLKRLKVSGYIQAQFQYADSSGQASFNGGNFPTGVDKRFSIRRGRVKFEYNSALNDKGWSTSQYVLQFDVTEKGLTIKDAFAKIVDPWCGWTSLTAGVQNRPFGYEVPYSSNLRESPERGRMSQIIFPGERDLGAMLTIQGPKTSNWNWIKLDAGLFTGNGAPGVGGDVSDFDKRKDFIGHLSINKSTASEKMKYSFGVSYYDGGFRIDSVNVYKSGTDSLGVNGFVVESKATDNGSKGLFSRGYTSRQYVGFDGQFSVDWDPGITTIRAEYIQGNQPGLSADTKSPNDKNPITKDIYNRKFNGAYFYFLQNILQTPLQVIVKYDWYDPNTDVKGDEIGKSVTAGTIKTNATDLRYDTWGFGLAYRWDANVKLTAYYDMVKNETSTNLSGYTKDRKDNVFTLRMQVKF